MGGGDLAKTSESGRAGSGSNAGAHVRLGRAGHAIGHSLFRRPRMAAPRAWTASMTMMAIAVLALSGLAMATLDPLTVPHVRAMQDGVVIGWARQLTDLGQSHWYLVPAALTVVALGLLDWSRRGRRGRARLSFVFAQAAYAFGAVAVSGLLVNLAKLLVGRSRPRLFDEGGPFQFDPFSMDSAFQSFPSGHATTAGALAVILVVWLPRLWPVILALGLALASTRIAALAHYPSDVIAGFGLGALYSLHLARWLAVRGRAFRIVDGKLVPRPRNALAWRRGASARSSVPPAT
jgi:membrane-associated phospholipid phosphatase